MPLPLFYLYVHTYTALVTLSAANHKQFQNSVRIPFKIANTVPFTKRRRAQNRASQRAYRERKDQRIKDLEQMLNDAKQRNDVLSQAYAELHAEYVALKASQLKDHGYPQHVDVAYSDPHSIELGTGLGLDLDMFTYSDVNTGYAL
jgi:hypothetical protein